MAYPAHYFRLLVFLFGATTFFAASVPGANWPQGTVLPMNEGFVLSLSVMLVGGLVLLALLSLRGAAALTSLAVLLGGLMAACSALWWVLDWDAENWIRPLPSLIATGAWVWIARFNHYRPGLLLWEALFPAALFVGTLGIFTDHWIVGTAAAAALIAAQFFWIPTNNVGTAAA